MLLWFVLRNICCPFHGPGPPRNLIPPASYLLHLWLGRSFGVLPGQPLSYAWRQHKDAMQYIWTFSAICLDSHSGVTNNQVFQQVGVLQTFTHRYSQPGPNHRPHLHRLTLKHEPNQRLLRRFLNSNLVATTAALGQTLFKWKNASSLTHEQTPETHKLSPLWKHFHLDTEDSLLFTCFYTEESAIANNSSPVIRHL